MAWFKREKKRIDQATPPDKRRVKTEGLWTKCEELPRHSVEKRPRSQLARLPKMPAPFSAACDEKARTAARFTMGRA